MHELLTTYVSEFALREWLCVMKLDVMLFIQT